LLPYVAKATTAWCAAYGVDANFWSEKDIGGRVCSWFDHMLEADSTAIVMLANVADDLMKCLDVLIRSGVAQASEIEKRISGMTFNRKTA
jgi:hypothetical protein